MLLTKCSRKNALQKMLPKTKCSLSKCSPSKCSPKKALQSNPRQPKLIDAPDLPTVVNGFETILRIYLSSTLLTHEFFLGSIFFGEHFDGEHFDREHFVSESIFWRAFYREHLAGSICLESIWPRIEKNASKFAMFMEKENPCSFFRFSFRATFIIPLWMHPGLCRHRPGHL